MLFQRIKQNCIDYLTGGTQLFLNNMNIQTKFRKNKNLVVQVHSKISFSIMSTSAFLCKSWISQKKRDQCGKYGTSKTFTCKGCTKGINQLECNCTISLFYLQSFSHQVRQQIAISNLNKKLIVVVKKGKLTPSSLPGAHSWLAVPYKK